MTHYTDPEFDDQPTPTELIERAQKLFPLIRDSADQGAAEHRVLPEVMKAIVDAGLLRVLQPRRWGGYEMDPRVCADIQFEIAKADMSAGWVYGVLVVHSFQMGLFEDQAAKDVWGENPDSLVCSAFPAGGVVTPVDGGYNFDGFWQFASGCDHVDWVFLGAVADGEFLTCLLPRSEFEIEDDWNTPGLAGTGSKKLLVDNRFIPHYRIHGGNDGFRCDSPGNKVNTGWLYRMPFGQVFLRGLSNAAVGCLEGMIDEFATYGASRIGVVAGPTAMDPDAQKALGEAIATLHEMKCVLRSNFDVLRCFAERGEVPPFDTRLLFKEAAASATSRSLDAARKLFENVGARGVYEDRYPFSRMYKDLTTARQHAASQDHLTHRSLGIVAMGGTADYEFYL